MTLEHVSKFLIACISRFQCKTLFVFLSVPPDYTRIIQPHELAFRFMCVSFHVAAFWLLKAFSSSSRFSANCSWVSLLITDTNQLDTLITIKATLGCNCLLITGHFAAFAVSQETCTGSDNSFTFALFNIYCIYNGTQSVKRFYKLKNPQ